MSDITLQFVVEPNNTNFVVNQNNINFTPTDISLSVFAGGYATAAGNVFEVQYNGGGYLSGSPAFLFNYTSNSLSLTGNANVSNLNVTSNVLATNANISNSVSTNTISATNISATNITVSGNANVGNFIANGLANLGNISNVKISGGSNNFAIITDGAGNLSFGSLANANYANFAGNVINAIQSNITSVGNLAALTVVGNANFTANATFSGSQVALGNVSNLKIDGGNNSYFLQTDGAGNLTWAVGTGNISGNGTPGGAINQIQYNEDGANFGGSTGFTFNPISNVMSAPGNINAVGNVSCDYILANGSFLTGINTSSISNGNSNVSVYTDSNIALSVGGNANILVVTGNGIHVNGTITAVDITANTGIFTGNGSGLTAIAGANVTGTVANATYAINAGTVITASQPNITSLGTLTGLGVNGTVTATNITANTGVFTGNAAGLTNLPAGNITGQVANALIAGTVYTNAQPNITSVGTLTNLSISGNCNTANINTTNVTITGTASLFNAIENVAILGAQTGTYNFDLLNNSIQYSTANAAANLIINFRGNSTTTANTILANGKSITSTYLMTNGANGYIISNVQIDGVTSNVKYVNGIMPSAVGNTVTAYTYTIVKTSTTPTYSIFGTITRYS